MQSSRHSIVRVTRALFAASVPIARTQPQIAVAQRAASLPPRGPLPLRPPAHLRHPTNPRSLAAALFHSQIPSLSAAALKYSPRSALPSPVAPSASVSVTGAGVIMVEHGPEGANVVLFRRRNNDCWEEPGGFLEPPCADPLGSALRELYEESCTLVKLDAAALAQSPGPAKYNGVPTEPTLLPLSLDVRGRSQATRYRCFFLSVPRRTAPSADHFAATRSHLEQTNSASSLLETTGIVRVPLINFARALADIECNLDSVIVSSPAQPNPELHSEAPPPLSSRPPAPVTAAFFPSERAPEPDTTFSGPGTFVEDEDGVQRRISPRTLKIFACGGMTLLEHLLPFNA